MTLTLLARGSTDPRHARDVAALSRRLTHAGVRTQVAFLDHDAPTPAGAARAMAADGVRRATVVPLLVSPHQVRADVPAAVSSMRSAAPGLALAVADPVGLHPLVLGAAEELVATSRLPVGSRTGVILAAAGSRDLRGMSSLEALLRSHGQALADRLGARAVRAAYLDGGRPLGRIRTLMRCVDGATAFLVVTLVLSDGSLRDRIVTAAGRHDLPVVPGTLAATDALADLIVLRTSSAREQVRQPAARTA